MKKISSESLKISDRERSLCLNGSQQFVGPKLLCEYIHYLFF